MAKLQRIENGSMSMKGRPCRLEVEPHLIEDFATLIREVYYPSQAANALRIHPETASRWLKSGERHIKSFHPECEPCNGNCEPQMVAFRRLYELVKNAQAEFTREDMQNIKSHAKKNWTASAWRLERTQPDEFGLKIRNEHTGKDGGPITHRVFSLEQRQRILKSANEALAIDLNKGNDGKYALPSANPTDDED